MRRDPIRSNRTAMLLLCAATCAAASTAQAVTVYDNGGPQSGGNAGQISSFVSANDFILTEETQLTAFTFWVSVRAEDTFAANFGGTVGWALFTDNGIIPGSLRFSGEDATLTTAATGLISLDGGEIVQIDADFTAGLTLPAGTYWLALHEGAWGSLFDGSEIFWQRGTLEINDPIRLDQVETSPSTWQLFSGFDGAFRLTGTTGSGSGGPGDGGPGDGGPGDGGPGDGGPGDGGPGDGGPGDGGPGDGGPGDGGPGDGGPGDGGPDDGNPGGGMNPGNGNGTALPEPASATMCLLSLAMLAARRRRA